MSDSPFTLALAHTARILIAGAARDGEHPRAEEYARTIDQHRVLWSGASPAQQKSAISATLKLADMGQDTVDAAIAALEG